MKNLKLVALLVLMLSVVIFSFASCDSITDIVSGIPGAENLLDKLPGGNKTDEHVHAFSDATCTAPKTCECGTTEGEALGHIYTDGKCACGAEDPNYVPPHEHSYVDGKCACGAEDPNYVPPHEHSYESVVTAPTCTEAGYTTYTCACGDSYVADEVEALGHTYESVVTAPTCTEAGYTTYTCACGDSYVADEVEALGHTYESVVTAPTCTEAGYTTYTCACGDSYVADEVEALGHTFIDGQCACGAVYTAPAGEWALTTELKNGDHVLIGAPAYGKLLSAEKVNASSYYNKGVNYSIDNFDNVTDAEIFVVTVNADGSYTFTSLTGDVIALAASYSSLNVDGEHKSWVLVDKGNGLFLLKNTGRNTYLEWYSSKDNWSTYTAGNTNEYELSFYVKSASFGEDHVHNHISEFHAATCTEGSYTSYTCACGDSYTVSGDDAATGHTYAPVVTAPTCTEAGYTTYTCACGDSYTADEVAALGHSYEVNVTAPTCTEAGYTTYTCACGDSYTADEVAALGHSFVDGKCDCGVEDPNYEAHVHHYASEVTAPTCTAEGTTVYTCACGDTYSEAIGKLGHLDEDLDTHCDREGCTGRPLPANGSYVSLFTANCLATISTSNQYYVVGTIVRVDDAKNGMFWIADDSGEEFYIRMIKDDAGATYDKWTSKLVLGDTITVYGTIKKFSTSSAPGGFYPSIQSGLLIEKQHEHVFSDPTCVDPGQCGCLELGDPATGHSDTDSDGICDLCEWNLKLQISNITVRTDDQGNGVLDADQTKWQWSDDNFTVEISKGASTFTIYKTAKAYMQLKKQNDFTVYNTNGAMIKTITIYTTNATQLANLEKAMANLTFTKNEADFSVTVEINSTEDFTFRHAGSTTVYVSGVEVVYEPAAE